MRDALEFFNRAQMTLSPSELERIRRMEAPIETGAKEASQWDDVKVPADTMVPLKDLVPLTEEQLKQASSQARGILGAVVAGFHHRVPELLARLATWEPEKALKLYIELMEYQTPKLQRVEQTGGVDHRHQVFVPVEARDNDPRLPLVIEGEIVTREEDPNVPGLPEPRGLAGGPIDPASPPAGETGLREQVLDGPTASRDGATTIGSGYTAAVQTDLFEAGPPWESETP